MNQQHQKHKISFCTTCMNRVHHLKDTLPQNIADNQAYGNVEFIVLNYSSKDDMDAWVRGNMMSYIDTGILTYLKIEGEEFWNPSHAKNIATKSATGDILCNVDADHYTGHDYASYVNNSFNVDSNMFMSGRIPGAALDMMGRFCVWRDDFHTVRGYDEGFLGYGFEDQDIYDRLKLIRRKEMYIDMRYLKTISHQHGDRVKGTAFMKEVKAIMISASSKDTRALVIKNDNTFEHFVLITAGQAVSVDENRISSGTWKSADSNTILQYSDGQSLTLGTTNNVEYILADERYRRITDNIDALYYYSLLFNQRIYKKNLKSNRAVVNEQGFGEGEVRKNFEW